MTPGSFDNSAWSSDDGNRPSWGKPEPLGDERRVRDLPRGLLPPVIDAYAHALAAQHGTAVDVVVVLLLPVVSTVINGRIKIDNGRYLEHVNIYVVMALAPGEGKSPIFGALLDPVDALEERLISEARPVTELAKARRDVWEANCKQLKKKAETAKDAAERRSLSEQLATLSGELNSIHVPLEPDLYTQDATPEGLMKLLAGQGGRASILSDEGAGTFDLMSRYSNMKKANQAPYLRGFDGRRVKSDWATRDKVRVNEANLVMGLAVQRQVVGSLGEDRSFRDRGLLARLDIVMPRSWVGERDTKPPLVPEELTNAYARLIDTLGRLAGRDVEIIEVDPDAVELFDDWHKSHEARLRPDVVDLDEIVDWAQKLKGKVWRYAGILHAIWNPESPSARPIDAVGMRRALDFADYLTDHALVAFAAMGANPVLEDARDVLGWLKAHRRVEVSKRDIYAAKPKRFPTADDVDPVIALLVDTGYLREMPMPDTHGRPGRKPSPRYDVNPYVNGPPIEPAKAEEVPIAVREDYGGEVSAVSPNGTPPVTTHTAGVATYLAKAEESATVTDPMEASFAPVDSNADCR